MSIGEDDTLRQKIRSLKVLQGPFKDWNFGAFPATPHDAFKSWFQEAIEAGVREPHAMTLSTVDEAGWPDARVLILKNVDQRGWHFAIKSGSPKGRHLANSGYAALTFYWPEQGRQIRIRGKATILPEDECARDFADRPASSKVGALSSKQSEILENEDELFRAVEKAQRHLESDPSPVLPTWRVYAVNPIVVEFWQGASSRLHKRVQYKLSPEDDHWAKHLLWP
ncbi:Pyridoxine/pyridoxamine 5'-phosphate oxidase [Paramyrothecium foliicola]|nr:Pyridoxine/pyridoxamine 5'-phosphate oxidase [Paramyrothecium foliicola]